MLSTLYLGGNDLEGPLPDLPASLGLIVINDNKKINGSVDNIDFSNLVDFRAANCSLTGAFPESAATSQALTMFSLRNNKLTGELPSSWDVPNLQMLLINDNEFKGMVHCFLNRAGSLLFCPSCCHDCCCCCTFDRFPLLLLQHTI